MKYTKERLDFYDKINYFNRYIKITNKHRNNLEDVLRKVEKKQVLIIFQELNYKAKYFNKENFYRIDEYFESFELQFWVSLKYGIVELGMSGENIISKKIITGGSFHRLQYTLDEDIEMPKSANYTSYLELKEILKEFLEIYEDFKLEFLKEY